MGKSKYTRLHIFYVNGYRNSAQTIIVKETDKMWQDVTSNLFHHFPEMFSDGFPETMNFKFYYWGHLKKEMAYKPIFSKYYFMMYGPDLNKLKEAWKSNTGFDDELPIGYNVEELINAVNLLNNGEISLEKRR